MKKLWIRFKKTPLRKKIGYALLIPALWSVVSFSLILTFGELLNDDNSYSSAFFEHRIQMEHFGSAWKGEYGFAYNDGGGGGGYTSGMPFYFGLMALAGAYLIKD